MKNKIKNIVKKTQYNLKNYKPNKKLTFLFFIIPILGILIKDCVIDNDIYFILSIGKYILKNGVPTIDPFTIHEGLNVVMQQWLSAIIFYKIYDVAGFFGLTMFTVLVNILILYLLYKLCMLISDNKMHLSVAISIIIDLLLAATFIRTRPQIFDFLILISELYILETYVRKKNTKILLLLPILSVLMINLHATSFFIMICFLIPYIIDSFKINLGFIKGEGYKKSPLILILIIMLLSGLINPYKIDAITYIFTSFDKDYISKFIIEMYPIDITNEIAREPIIVIALSIGLYIFHNKKNFKLRYFLLYIGTLYLALKAVKGAQFFYIAGLFSLADYLKDDFKECEIQEYSKKFNKEYTIIIMVVILIFSFLILKIYKEKNYLKSKKSLEESVQVLKKINKENKDIKIYADYYSGGYLELNGLKPYIDARADVFYKSNNKKRDIMKEYYNLQKKNISPKSFLNKYNFTHILVDEHDTLYDYLKNNKKYRCTYKTKTKKERYYIYEKIK